MMCINFLLILSKVFAYHVISQYLHICSPSPQFIRVSVNVFVFSRYVNMNHVLIASSSNRNMARISSKTRNGLLIIAVAVVVALAVILAITLSKGPKPSTKTPRASSRDGEVSLLYLKYNYLLFQRINCTLDCSTI